MNRLNKEEALKKLLEMRNTDSFQSSLADRLKKLAQPKTDKEVFTEISAENPTLGAIAMTESSGGKDYSHALDPKSNTHAGGMFGMMPNTAKDVLRLNPDLAKQYPELVKEALNDNPQAFTDRFNQDPEAAADFAKAHYARNKAKLDNDEDATAYSWFWGLTNALKNQKNKQLIANDSYLQKIKGYTEK